VLTKRSRLIALLFSPPLFCLGQAAQKPAIPINYDEALVGSYRLPDPLLLANGKPVRDAKTWYKERRPELVRLFETEQYGRSPERPTELSFDPFDKGTPAFDGKAVRKQIEIHFSTEPSSPKADLALYLPADAKTPVPVLLYISFTANSATIEDPGLRPGEIWNRDKKRVPASEGRRFGTVKVADFLQEGFGVATIYYGDIESDFAGGARFGVRGLFLKPGQTEPSPDGWGAIAAWGWGLSRAMDYLETDPGVDSKRVAVAGVSRLGKTVLWAGARHTRFAMVDRLVLGRRGRRIEPPQLWGDGKELERQFSIPICPELSEIWRSSRPAPRRRQ